MSYLEKELENILNSLLSSDNRVRTNAEEDFENAKKNPDDLVKNMIRYFSLI